MLVKVLVNLVYELFLCFVYDVIDVKVSGLEEHKDLEIYFCGYYIVNDQVYYIDNGMSGLDTPFATTYNEIAKLFQPQ